MKSAFSILAFLFLAPLAMLHAAADSKPVKVFILVGQSNMEGKAPNALLDYQATNATPKASSLICARTTNGSCATMSSSSFSTAKAR